ncbi:MAG: carboxypeptidase regulatory-like domain-containing protein [Saprospiraceae bacterium]|nr:MAG: TonB-dependent receptor [Bacteroidetes bacterium OLB9]MCO6464841.1 carboxypeptidase regulatory-like domain-containing protein [Saprospiraceae bacterium]MCZ2339407.1 carboxypeptidase regulatory-like domain-containing protein [Chitinophagales bacterium]
MNRLLLILSILFVSLSAINAQTTIEGKVTEASSGDAIIQGPVQLFRNGVLVGGTVTDLDGNYFFSDVQPGTYDMQVEYFGFATKKITGIVIQAGRTNKINFELSDDAQLLDLGVEIVAYKVPLIEFDNTTQGATVTAEKIRALPTKQINAIAATSAGISSTDGGAISVRGSRSNETVYFLDGVRVTGNLIPQSEIEQLQVVVGGIEARYGDVTGGVISLTSRGPSNNVTGSFEVEKSLDGYGYNLISGNISGPILKNKDNQSIIGYRFSGQYRNVADNSPSALGVWRAPESLIRELEANPVYSIGGTLFPSIETKRTEDLGGPFKARPNDENIDLDVTGRLDFRLSKNIDVQLSGSYNDRKDRFTPSTGWSLLNWVNNPYQYSNTYRGNFRLTHKIGRQSGEEEEGKSTSGIKNFSYSVILGYQKSKSRSEDFRHEDRLFDYGYFGKTARTWDPVFGFFESPRTIEVNGEPRQFFAGLLGYREVVGEYIPNTVINPVLGSYNAINGVNVNGLLNDNVNVAWNNLYSNVGQVYSNFSKSNDDRYSINLTTGFDLFTGNSDKGRHNIQIGFLYEQSINRGWGVSPFDLWNLAELQANLHINGVDTTNVLRFETMETPNGTLELPVYQTNLNINNDNLFYRAVREVTGQSDNDYVNVWDLDPSQLSLDMFSASELINRQGLISYYGFDYLGNKLGTDVRFDDFFTSRDANNRRTFLVAPFQPIYGAVFLQDKFSFKDIIFRLGVRMDYFDANTKVMRDPYALYEIESAKDYYARTGLQQPTSVGDDYNVYVVSEEDQTVKAFRKGDQWFLPNGSAVSGGNIIYQGSLVYPSYAGINKETGLQERRLEIQSSGADELGRVYKSEYSFVDYKPQLNFMPRLAFSFPISDDAGFFAHYDVLYQRPPSNSFSSALDFYFWEDISRINPREEAMNNPNLKPVRTVDYEVGFQQKLSESMAMKVSAYYKEMKDLIQQRVLANVAAPLNTYKIFDNLDFGTVKGFSFTLDRRRTNNLELTATYTLQFADGSGSDANSSSGINTRGPIRNLIPLSFDERHRITGVIDYRYGSGKAYNGPRIGGINILEDFGVNITSFLVSGKPYTKNSTPASFGGSGFAGSINGARLPWTFTTDLNVQKRFPITLSKESGKKMWFNAYFRVQNLFNTKNIINLYKYSGDPDNDGYLQSSFGQDRIQGVISTKRDLEAFLDAYSWRMSAPGNYTLPRRMYVGVIVDF